MPSSSLRSSVFCFLRPPQGKDVVVAGSCSGLVFGSAKVFRQSRDCGEKKPPTGVTMFFFSPGRLPLLRSRALPHHVFADSTHLSSVVRKRRKKSSSSVGRRRGKNPTATTSLRDEPAAKNVAPISRVFRQHVRKVCPSFRSRKPTCHTLRSRARARVCVGGCL